MGFDYENAKMDILDNGGDPDYLDMNHPDERDSYLKNMGLNPKDYSSASGFSSGQRERACLAAYLTAEATRPVF